MTRPERAGSQFYLLRDLRMKDSSGILSEEVEQVDLIALDFLFVEDHVVTVHVVEEFLPGDDAVPVGIDFQGDFEGLLVLHVIPEGDLLIDLDAVFPEHLVDDSQFGHEVDLPLFLFSYFPKFGLPVDEVQGLGKGVVVLSDGFGGVLKSLFDLWHPG